MSSSLNRLLVVDDDWDTRTVLRELLETEGYCVVTAGNGQDALAVLQRDPDACAILLDLMMPVMDGWEFLRWRRNDERLSRIPVIVISAYRERAPRDGIAGVVSKPIAFDKLLTILQQFCTRKSSL